MINRQPTESQVLPGILTKSLAFSVFLIGCMLASQAGGSTIVNDETIRQLESDHSETRNAAMAKISNEQHTDAARIADIFLKYRSVDARKGTAKDALLVLGKLRASEYVPLLIENLTFQVFYLETNRPQTTADQYPAVQALIDIGSPALRPLLQRLETEDGGTLGRTGATVLRGVLGERWATAILEYEIAAAPVGPAAERLRRVLLQMKNLPN